jgi:integrase
MAKNEIKHNVLFFPDKETRQKDAENVFIDIIKDKDGNITDTKYYNYDAKLRIRIRWAKNVVNFNLSERVELAKWSTDAQRCNNGTSHGKKKRTAKDINTKIESTIKNIDSIFDEFEKQNIIPTVDEFRDKYNNQTKSTPPEKVKTFFDYYDDFVNKQSIENNWKYATLQKFATVKNHLTAFNKDLTFEKLTKDDLNNYVVFLREKKDMRNSTILKQIAFVKWFLKWAAGEGYNPNLAFSTFFPKMDKVEKKVIFLDWAELTTVYNFDFSTAQWTLPDGTKKPLDNQTKISLERVRDVFCFCCFTSLRYSDVENLKRSDIKDNEIEITTIKTAHSLTIDLNNYSRAILAKYASEVYPNNKALPVISNQKMNDRLKEVGELCGLNTPITITYYKGAERIDEVYPKYELIGTHCGRRTFICNALTLGIAPQTVMKWSGHANYISMKPYIDIADTEKKKAMDLFNR